ncbi:hypothetical protein [Tardiphaga sp.]|uniref:hypothetical protein n=1 Tax=Tardiphaga sp. TaxID=1926292 RepID=UPI0025D09F5B|nr:hypothetical protein [Tardiphaga sp.]
MSHLVSPIWREDIDSLAFQPDGHDGLCMMHRRAFRVLLRSLPTPRQCEEFFLIHRDAFQAAADAKLRRAAVGPGNSFHVTSRDIRRQLEN